MTDREAMQQALEALTRIWEDGLDNYPVWAHEVAIDDLRERLAQPEHDDPIGDAQAKLIAEQEQEPQMQPCAGRNCGSTNPNLHSAECFEDYEKATSMNQRKPLPPQSPCEMTQAEGRMFKLGWLECEAAHGIKGEA